MNDTDDPDTDIAIEIRRKEACRTAIESMGRIATGCPRLVRIPDRHREHGPDTADATEHPAPA